MYDNYQPKQIKIKAEKNVIKNTKRKIFQVFVSYFADQI